MTLLEEHVDRFNEGVRTGDWSRMLEQFTDDGELVFEGIPVGPFRGRDSIQSAYREQPPDDEIVLLEDDGNAGIYAWQRQPGVRAGQLRLEVEQDRIRRLTVVYER